EQLARPRPGKDAGEFEDAETGKGRIHAPLKPASRRRCKMPRYARCQKRRKLRRHLHQAAHRRAEPRRPSAATCGRNSADISRKRRAPKRLRVWREPHDFRGGSLMSLAYRFFIFGVLFALTGMGMGT